MKTKLKTACLILLIGCGSAQSEESRQLSAEQQKQKSQDLLISASERLMDQSIIAEQSLEDVQAALEEKRVEKLLIQKELLRLQRDAVKMRQKYIKQPSLANQVEEMYGNRLTTTKARLSVVEARIARLESLVTEQELNVAGSKMFLNSEEDSDSSNWDAELAQLVQERYASGKDLLKPAAK